MTCDGRVVGGVQPSVGIGRGVAEPTAWLKGTTTHSLSGALEDKDQRWRGAGPRDLPSRIKTRGGCQELDRVVGRDRMPGPEDMSELPYIMAMVKETLRWRTVTILAGIPHAPLVDDVYKGYTIPKGTGIVGNMWAIHRNPRDFSEPDRFKPERYLGGKLERPYPVARGHHAFGFGRRVCSGQPQAEQGLALAIAKLMWGFKIRPGVDASVSPRVYLPHV